MKVLIVLCSLIVAGYAWRKCYFDVLEFCDEEATTLNHCGTDYGHAKHFKEQLQNYVNLHINSSFEYLLMTSNFGGYVKNREGMEKVLRHLSDSTWNDAIELVKYMNIRGMTVDFSTMSSEIQGKKNISFTMNEITSLGYALDSQKLIAKKAIDIHRKASEKSAVYEPEVASFLENNFLHRHADAIRNLAGLTSDLQKFVAKNNMDSSVSVFLFDEYLKKVM